MSDMRTALLLILLAGCTATQARHANRVGAVLTVASMACDWGGTRQAAGERHDAWERGFPARSVMGGSPSTGRVDAYFVASTAAILALAQLIPERYRWLGYGATVGVESGVAYSNLSTTRGVCGLSL